METVIDTYIGDTIMFVGAQLDKNVKSCVRALDLATGTATWASLRPSALSADDMPINGGQRHALRARRGQ